MGVGDDIMATGMARGASARGKRIAFGDGRKIIWGPYSEMVFKDNPNIARPGTERAADIEWVHYYKGSRIYNKQGDGKWIWNYSFKVRPGEFYFSDQELQQEDSDLILVEPNLPKKSCAVNKRWPIDRWKEIESELVDAGFRVRQFEYGGEHRIAQSISTPTFRHAAAVMKGARLAILPEGGLHHAAAAVGLPAVVLFGGCMPPSVLGYDTHINLTGGATSACGSFNVCKHCTDAMGAIKVGDVLGAVEKLT